MAKGEPSSPTHVCCEHLMNLNSNLRISGKDPSLCIYVSPSFSMPTITASTLFRFIYFSILPVLSIMNAHAVFGSSEERLDLAF